MKRLYYNNRLNPQLMVHIDVTDSEYRGNAFKSKKKKPVDGVRHKVYLCKKCGKNLTKDNKAMAANGGLMCSACFYKEYKKEGNTYVKIA